MELQSFKTCLIFFPSPTVIQEIIPTCLLTINKSFFQLFLLEGLRVIRLNPALLFLIFFICLRIPESISAVCQTMVALVPMFPGNLVNNLSDCSDLIGLRQCFSMTSQSLIHSKRSCLGIFIGSNVWLALVCIGVIIMLNLQIPQHLIEGFGSFGFQIFMLFHFGELGMDMFENFQKFVFISSFMTVKLEDSLLQYKNEIFYKLIIALFLMASGKA